MVNDSIVNFYLLYSYNQTIEDEMTLNAVSKEEAVALINNTFQGSEEKRELIYTAMNVILKKRFVFSTFFFPLLKGLRKVHNEDVKEKVLKWSRNGHIFERDFVLFPIFQHSHFSLILFCYPNRFKEYIHTKTTINGIDYSKSIHYSFENTKQWNYDSKIGKFV